MAITKFRYNSDGIAVHHSLSEKPKDEEHSIHTHETVEIYFFVSGACKYLVEGNEYELTSGDLMVMRPSESHKLCVIDNTPYERIVINIDPQIFERIDPSGVLYRPFGERKLGRINQYRTEHFTDDLYEVCVRGLTEESAIGATLEIRSKLFLLLCEIAKAYAARIADGKEEDRRKNRTVAHMISYINRNLSEPLSLEALSRQFFLSKSQISRLFREATGTTVWDYITAKRLLSARARIRTGENAGRVAAEVGFREYSTFYRMYKARFGVSPKADAPAI